MRNDEGWPIGLLGINRDISARKQAEEGLRQSAERFRNLIEGSLHGILMHCDDRALFVNQAYVEIGYASPQDIYDLETLTALIAPHERERLTGYRDARLAGEAAPTRCEYQGRRVGAVSCLSMTSRPWFASCPRCCNGWAYEVVASDSSPEALTIFQADPQRFDLVVTDQTMPQMTGEALALRRIRPDIPIILCTGFSDAVNAETAARLGIDAFCMKPLLARELVEAIRQVLGKRVRQEA